MLDRIFKDLGTRLRKENDLSDFTWAVAKNCEEFLYAFMELFGFDFNSEGLWEIYREYHSKSAGPADIVVKNGNKLFIIENKIYDTNYHFQAYSRAFGAQNARFGIIVNHAMNNVQIKEAERYNFIVKGWDEFVKLLENKLNGKEYTADVSPIIEAYIGYVKEVCFIMPIEEIRFERLVSLYYFHNLIKKIIEEYQNENIECKLYNLGISRQYNECGSGQYFTLSRIGRIILYPWFGIWYGEDPPIICITFEEDWNPEEIYSKFMSKGGSRSLYDIEPDEFGVNFNLNQDKFNEFNTSSKERQKEILVEFLNEVINEVAQYL